MPKIVSSSASRRRPRCERPADAQMGGGALIDRDERIGRSPHAIVREGTGTVHVKDEASARTATHSFARIDSPGFPVPERASAWRYRRRCRGSRSGPNASRVAAGRRLSFAAMRSATFSVKPFGTDARQSHGPRRGAMVEREQRLLRERRQKLDREERIAARLLLNQLRERRQAARAGAVKRNQPPAARRRRA